MRALRQLLEYLAYRCLAFLVPLLPRGAVVWLGRRLGGLYLLVDRRPRETAIENLERVFPELDPAERKRIMVESFRLQGVALLDMLWSKRIGADNLSTVVEAGPGAAELYAAAAGRGNGTVVVTGHFGSWEMMIHWGANSGIPRPNFIARPVPNPRIDAHVRRMREQTGARLVYREQAILKCLTALRNNEIACSVIDMAVVPSQGGVFVDFFGTPALTAVAMPALAVRRKSPLLHSVCRPIDKGRRYVLEAEEIEVRPDADRDEETLRLTAEMTKALERCIRAHPEAWIWNYKRWKWRPCEQPWTYPTYSTWVNLEW